MSLRKKIKVELLKQLIHLLKLNATDAMETDISQQLRRQKQVEQQRGLGGEMKGMLHKLIHAASC